MATAKTFKTAIKERTVILLNHEDITNYLKSIGYNDIPSNVEIVIPVPDEGDWSNTNLDINDTYIKVSYIKTISPKEPNISEF